MILFLAHQQGMGVGSSVSATVTADALTESDIVAGGKQIVLTVIGDTWVAAGAAFNAIRQDIIDGLDSAQSETLGWNNEVRDKEVVGAVVRTSDTVVTITLTASPAYDITANETITVTIPATALSLGLPVVAAQQVSVQAAAGVIAAGRKPQRKRKQRRMVVEVDGEMFEVSSIVEAEQLLARATEVAEQQIAKAPLKKRVTLVREIPQIKTDVPILRPVVMEARQRIRKVYEDAARDAEIARLLMQRVREEDEEDALLALML